MPGPLQRWILLLGVFASALSAARTSGQEEEWVLEDTIQVGSTDKEAFGVRSAVGVLGTEGLLVVGRHLLLNRTYNWEESNNNNDTLLVYKWKGNHYSRVHSFTPNPGLYFQLPLALSRTNTLAAGLDNIASDKAPDGGDGALVVDLSWAVEDKEASFLPQPTYLVNDTDRASLGQDLPHGHRQPSSLWLCGIIDSDTVSEMGVVLAH